MSAVEKFPEPNAAHKNGVPWWNNDATLVNWAISLFLIAIVSTAYTFVGTGSFLTSLLAGIVAISCLLLALVILVVYISHRNRRPGAG